nr:MAG TPA: hypothetical protein [Caudoviricetes sp.]
MNLKENPRNDLTSPFAVFYDTTWLTSQFKYIL